MRHLKKNPAYEARKQGKYTSHGRHILTPACYCRKFDRNHRAKLLALAANSGIMAASPAKGLVSKNTISTAVSTPTVSGVLSCLDSGMGRPAQAALPHAYGRGASYRKDGGMAVFMFLAPRPPIASKNALGGFLTHTGV